MKKNVIATILTMAVLLAGMPVTALAENTTISPSDGDTATVVASADVTEEDLEELDLNLVLSLPASVSLTLDENKNFTGGDVVYAYGLMDEDTKLVVEVDTDHADYGNVYFKKNDTTEAKLFDNDSYNGSVTETLSNAAFTSEHTLANYLKIAADEDVEHTAALSVCIEGMIPIYGIGDYYTNVPLVVSFEDVQ